MPKKLFLQIFENGWLNKLELTNWGLSHISELLWTQKGQDLLACCLKQIMHGKKSSVYLKVQMLIIVVPALACNVSMKSVLKI